MVLKQSHGLKQYYINLMYTVKGLYTINKIESLCRNYCNQHVEETIEHNIIECTKFNNRKDFLLHKYR